jgi:7-keto-8-aminopelargonate synthetase-like enzyme
MSKTKTRRVFEESYARIDRAVRAGLMQNGIAARTSEGLRLSSGEHVVDFSNCSYLGLDVDPGVVRAARDAVERWGVHYCCARSRLTIEDNRELERELAGFFGGTVLTFPSVTSAHMSALPLLASGLLLQRDPRPMRILVDRFAHASMQFLRPLLAGEATLETVPHNDLGAVVRALDEAEGAGERVAYVGDGVYSMGTTAPVAELLELSRRRGLLLYLDDAHGTSVFGERGEGLVASALDGPWPETLCVTFSLAKGFGCNGGGIVVPSEVEAAKIRAMGMTFAFSGPLDFAIVGAARASLALHRTPRLEALRQKLRENVALFDAATADLKEREGFSPIRMVPVGDEDRAVAVGERLLADGYYVPVAFYPVVPRQNAQLRICVTARHTEEQIRGLAEAIRRALAPRRPRRQRAIMSGAATRTARTVDGARPSAGA